MRRGRPSKRREVAQSILDVLSSVEVPMSVLSIKKRVEERIGRVSWNTVKKYLDELVTMERVEAIPLPHSKLEGKEGLTVYRIKR